MKKKLNSVPIIVLGLTIVTGLMGTIAVLHPLKKPSDGEASILHDSASRTFYQNPKLQMPLITQAEKTIEDEEKERTAQDFRVYQNSAFLNSYASFAEAVAYAKRYAHSAVAYKEKAQMVWSNNEEPLPSVKLDIPLVLQMPELERGCEVTSLSMLLQSAGKDVDKMTLAKQIEKDPTPFEYKDDERYFGNPNDGFVGDMESFKEPGYGVYHGPIEELAEQYVPNQVIDGTGTDFDQLLYFIEKGSPLWVIVNMDYHKLDDSEFESWETPDEGLIDITYKEHSVLVTGYDDEYVYINDPLGDTTQVDRESFQAAWEQMGKQAIALVPKEQKQPNLMKVGFNS